MIRASGKAGGRALGTSVTVMSLGLGIIASALPLFGQLFGVGSALVGVLITVFGLGRLALNLPTGYLAVGSICTVGARTPYCRLGHSGTDGLAHQ